MSIYHKHHIVPRHMGGTDDPSNLIELTIEEHAEAHRKLFEQYGHWEDEFAWKGLSGMIDRAELIRKIQSKSSSFRQKGSGNSQFGTRWITDGKSVSKISVSDEIPEGWVLGRKIKSVKINKRKIKKISEEDALSLLNDYESGMAMELILKKYNRKTEQSVTTFLRKRFPNRKKFNPKERQYGRTRGNRTLVETLKESC